MSNTGGGDADHQTQRPKRMTRSVGLVLIGTAAFMLGMPGCDNRGGATTRPTTRSSRSSSYHSHGYYGGGQRTNGSSLSSHAGGHTVRGGFGSTGHGVGS